VLLRTRGVQLSWQASLPANVSEHARAKFTSTSFPSHQAASSVGCVAERDESGEPGWCASYCARLEAKPSGTGLAEAITFRQTESCGDKPDEAHEPCQRDQRDWLRDDQLHPTQFRRNC